MVFHLYQSAWKRTAQMYRDVQLILLLIISLAWLTACSSIETEVATNETLKGDVDIAAMVEAHNRWRKEAGVPPLIWSARLERQAAGWAEQLAARGCKLRHNRPGQNLFWMQSGGQQYIEIRPVAVVDFWASEKDWYTLKTNRCDAPAGKNCWHYSQLIWRDTRELGCARRICGTQAQVWVCNYSPAGNIFGQPAFQ